MVFVPCWRLSERCRFLAIVWEVLLDLLAVDRIFVRSTGAVDSIPCICDMSAVLQFCEVLWGASGDVGQVQSIHHHHAAPL